VNSNLSRFARKMAARHGGVGGPFAAYDEAEYGRLHAWSVREARVFWREVFEDLELAGSLGSPAASGPVSWPREGSPGATSWFEDAAVNHAEMLLEGGAKADSAAALLVAAEGSEARRTVTYGELRARTAALAAALREDGVGPGDRVAGVVENDDDAVVAMLAATSLGASWCSVSADFGEKAILDRLAQVQPVALFAATASRYRGARRPVALGLGELRSIRRCVALGEEEAPAAWGATPLREYGVSRGASRPEYARGGFDREVYVMFSSGTTGRPKCLAQGIGATLGHAKEGAYHMDLRPGDRSFWYTTCGWMMWNYVVGAALSTGGAVCLYSGDPLWRGGSHLFTVAADCALFGSSARHLAAASTTVDDLSFMTRLRVLGSTGSPCAAATFDWAARLAPGVPLVSTSGGTEINGSFATGNPWLPVRSETLQSAGLGLDVVVRDPTGALDCAPGEPGELACASPFPSAPLYLLGDDPHATAYRAAYFQRDFADGAVWRHGDWCLRDAAGGFLIFGRSDATLNPGGVRIGTSDIYNLLDNADDALVAASPFVAPDGGAPDVRVVLFLKAPDDATAAALDAALAADDADALLRLARPPDALVSAIVDKLRTEASPRHVPAAFAWCPRIPVTHNGKKLEVAVNRALALDDPADPAAVARLKASVASDPAALDFFLAIAPRIPDLLWRRRRRRADPPPVPSSSSSSSAASPP